MKRFFAPVPIPDSMSTGPVRLQFVKFFTPDGHPELVPYYHFWILVEDEVVGHVNLRLGDTNHIQQVAGHIGYLVHPEFRGNSYSYYGCKALVPLIKKHYDVVIITADRNNEPSIGIIEKLGAVVLGEIEVPPSDPAYREPGEVRVRYEWVPEKA